MRRKDFILHRCAKLAMYVAAGCWAICAIGQTPEPSSGPKRGYLIVAGGGSLGPEIQSRFRDLVGGLDAPVVLIPTADGKTTYDEKTSEDKFLQETGFRNITVLHTMNRKEADSRDFVKPLKAARGVWIAGGRQWRLVDSYLDTRTLRELRNLLDRGGVIGGTSAGASIQASYMVRGARETNQIMMAPGYERGFGFLENAAVDQHLIAAGRLRDLLQVIHVHPNLLGIGIDEHTAIVVHGDVFEVIGASKVAIYDATHPQNGPEAFYFLSAGDRFNIQTRQKLP